MAVASLFTQEMTFDFQVTIMRSLFPLFRPPLISVTHRSRLLQKILCTITTGVWFSVVTLPFSPDTKATPVPKSTDKNHPFYSFCKVNDCFIFLKKQTGSDTLLKLPASDGYIDQSGLWRMEYNPMPQSHKSYSLPLDLPSDSELNGIEMNYEPATERLNMIYMVSKGGDQTYGFLSFKVRRDQAANKRPIIKEMPEKPVSLVSSGNTSVVVSTDKVWLIQRKKMIQMPFPGNNENPLSIKKVIMDKNHDIYVIASRTDDNSSPLPIVYRYQYDSDCSDYKEDYELFIDSSSFNNSKTYVDFTVVKGTFYAISQWYAEDGSKVLTIQGYDTKTQQDAGSMMIAAYGGYRSLSVANDRLFLITEGFGHQSEGKGLFKFIEIADNRIRKTWRTVNAESENNDVIARVTGANKNNLTVLVPKTTAKACKKNIGQDFYAPGCTLLDKYTLTD